MAEKASMSSVTHIKSKIKVVFLGQQSTGKTSILMRFINDKFEEGLGATVGIDFMAKNLTVGSNQLRLQLWDTAGQERFRSLIPSYLKDAMITFIVFDVGNAKSFENLTEWFDLCSHNRKQKNISILLGNKCDLSEEREVTVQQAQKKAKEYNVKYFQVSAKTGHNIKSTFNYAGSEYVNINSLQNDMSFSKIVTFKDLNDASKAVPVETSIKINQKEIQAKNVDGKNKKKGCC